MVDITITYKNILLTICVEHYSPFVAGRHNGPPEDCQEDEQEEIEWLIAGAKSIPDIKSRDYKNLLPHEKEEWKESIYILSRLNANIFTDNYPDERQEIHTLISKEINQHQVTRRQHRNPSVMPSISFSGG